MITIIWCRSASGVRAAGVEHERRAVIHDPGDSTRSALEEIPDLHRMCVMRLRCGAGLNDEEDEQAAHDLCEHGLITNGHGGMLKSRCVDRKKSETIDWFYSRFSNPLIKSF
jgi:hypothetical protein